MSHNHCRQASKDEFNLNNFTQFQLPFPPTIRASDIAQKRLRSRICSKSPNAFFIYRKAFVDQLSNFSGSNKLKMTEVSRLVSSRWKMESKQVKLAYEEIAKQVEKELNDIRNKDLVYADDFDIGNGRRRKNKNHKRGRRSTGFSGDAFLMSIKGGNFNISTLDFSKPDNENDNDISKSYNNNDNDNSKPDNDNDNNNNNNNNINNSNINNNDISDFNSNSSNSSFSTLSSPSLSQEHKESLNYEESMSSDEFSTPEFLFDNDYNDYNDYNDNNIQQFQYPNFYSPISDTGRFELVCDSVPQICDEETNHYIVPYQPSEFNLYLNNNCEDSTSSFSYSGHEYSFGGRGLDYYLGYFDNLS